MTVFERSPPGNPSSPDETPLTFFELSYRVATCLENGGFKTAGQVRNASDADLMLIYNFGKLSLMEARREIGESKVRTGRKVRPEVVADFRRLASQLEALISRMQAVLSHYE